MQCFVDTWAVILDDRNKPLVGKIGFYEPNTTTLKNIFGTDEVIPLENPIYCNGVTTSQVLLDEGDYTARYWRYIGNGNMESDNNEDSWLLYKTELIKDGSVVQTDFAGNGIVETIDELKELTGMEDGDICLVHGYYTKDDCPARYFVWHEGGTYTDDGGVCVKSNSQNTGAWIMKIPGTYIDVRWFGDIPSNAWNGTSSNLGQRAKAAAAANKYSKDLYFPSYKNGTQNGFYVFNGSNTVSVSQNIICDNAVRFVVKHGTTGTVVSCSEFVKDGRYLFVSEYGEQIGGYEIHADWIKTSWLNSSTVNPLNWARQGFIVDEMQAPLTLQNVKLKIEQAPYSGTTLNNCEMLECNKKINDNITIQNMEIDTDWFADNYDWSKLSLSGCRILLRNCKDANTYIILKNKQNESDYGDLGEQQINAQIRAGGTIENCYGTVQVLNAGAIEFHNVSLVINDLTASNSINAVDSWLTINSAITLGSIQLRRGSLAGTGGITLIGDSMIENAQINIPLNTTGILLTVRNSDIYGYIRTRHIKLINNQIYSVIDQSDLSGVVYVYLSGNMFHDNGVHYVHADTAESVVNGIWIANGSTYDDKHWIRLNRKNLKYQDYDHNYTYSKNAEPYLMKWSGRNRPLRFKRYGGYWSNSETGVGIFSTTTIPFIFLNYRERNVSVVPRQNYWKTFTVGRGFLARTGHIQSNLLPVGIQEGDYNDHKNGQCAVVWTWGAQSFTTSMIGAAQMVSRDSDGLAEYNVSFEGQLAEHGRYSYGAEIGNLPSSDWDSGSDKVMFPTYPAASNGYTDLFIMMDPDFSTGNNPQNVFS